MPVGEAKAMGWNGWWHDNKEGKQKQYLRLIRLLGRPVPFRNLGAPNEIRGFFASLRMTTRTGNSKNNDNSRNNDNNRNNDNSKNNDNNRNNDNSKNSSNNRNKDNTKN